jgi:hypothetical protein
MMADHRDEPLIRHGEILRDRFRAALEDFENNPLKKLKEKYKSLFGLKDGGAMDDVGKLLSPYEKPREDAEYTPIYMVKSLEVFKRLFASAHFYKDFVEFKESYVEACESLLELSKDAKLTQLERRKLSAIAQEFVISLSIDLLNVGLNYQPPHEYRYRPHLHAMQLLNGRLEREVVPVGVIIQFDQGAGGGSSLILPP